MGIYVFALLCISDWDYTSPGWQFNRGKDNPLKHPLRAFVLSCAFLAFGAAVGVAESIAYTFTGTGWVTRTSFTYIAPDGFLSFDTGKLVPTTATHFYFKTTDYGQILFIDFIDERNYRVYFDTPNYGTYFELGGIGETPYSLNTFGTQTLNFGTLSIASISSVPEPSGMALLATGTLGLAVLLRRKGFCVRSSLTQT